MRRAWRQYLDLVEPLRPELHAYWRSMSRSVWDAEDLVQETLLRGFE
jgi:RNA polymerase sigma-70 factor (ECF subfamily)